ncbi:hypothetical protein [Sphingobacterium corticibacter]|uniref:Uncharacterized protein n=1 Tax=Sphingobacterium corticibacter TaxID=2171749 RepID=A0A2T8HM83_9SPHI|nr:hypothetical protein [Sphingobacterium corticibacter]PVH26510.1 hypothetical protein DC487_02530 [Sphingobacterium corticibacter]
MTQEEAIHKGKTYYQENVAGNSIEEEKGFHLVEENEEYSIFLDNNTADISDPALLSISDADGHEKFMERYQQIEQNSSYCETIDSSTYRVCAIPK